MRILYVGDVMGELGIDVVEHVVPKLRIEQHVDLVIAQAENVTEGRGITPSDFVRLKKAGIDFCTGGNWSLHHRPTRQAWGTSLLKHLLVECWSSACSVRLLGKMPINQ
jgi:calcineurin-like phosphoesterase